MAYHHRYAYFHGFASSPLATKAQSLRRVFSAFGLDLAIPDLNRPTFSELSPSACLRAIEALCGADDEPSWRIIASSFGALLGTAFAESTPERVDRMVLLAPAFDFAPRWAARMGPEAMHRWLDVGAFPFENGAGEIVPVHYRFFEEVSELPAAPHPPVPILILHGVDDEIVPIEGSRRYAEEHDNVVLVELEGDHRLHDQIDRIDAEVQRFFELGRATLQ